MNGKKRAKLVWKHIEVEICGLEVPRYFYGKTFAPNTYVHEPEVQWIRGTEKYRSVYSNYEWWLKL